MKKRKLIIIVCFGIIFLITLICFIIQFFDIFHTMPVVSLNDLSATQYEVKTDVSYIKNIKYGKIISKEKVVNTTTLGTKKIVIVIENNYGKARDYQFFVKVKKAK